MKRKNKDAIFIPNTQYVNKYLFSNTEVNKQIDRMIEIERKMRKTLKR